MFDIFGKKRRKDKRPTTLTTNTGFVKLDGKVVDELSKFYDSLVECEMLYCVTGEIRDFKWYINVNDYDTKKGIYKDEVTYRISREYPRASTFGKIAEIKLNVLEKYQPYGDEPQWHIYCFADDVEKSKETIKEQINDYYEEKINIMTTEQNRLKPLSN